MATRFDIASLAVPAVLSLITFLSYSSQYLFLFLDPEPLSTQEWLVFNANLLALLVCYGRAVLTDPGRVPGSCETAHGAAQQRQQQDREDKKKEELGLLTDGGASNDDDDDENDDGDDDALSGDGAKLVVRRQRWCRSCESRKPPRSHHCRICNRCIPKMDHHCPWTYNCVSHRTYPHFVRFLLYSVSAMVMLERFIWTRGAHLWSVRNYASSHELSAWQLAHLMILFVANSLSLLGLSLLLARTIWGMLFNITTIEDWEIDRHETLLRRAKNSGGYLDGPDGLKVRIKRQEFPYDIGMWSNIVQGMGTSNVLAWFWPFASSPTLESGFDFATNDLEDPSIGWPPPDPERIPRLARNLAADAVHQRVLEETPNTQLASFRARQAQDMQRYKNPNGATQTSSTATGYSLTIPATNEVVSSDSTPTPSPLSNFRRRHVGPSGSLGHVAATKSSLRGQSLSTGQSAGAQSWRNDEGERLEDFGLDEDVEFFDEDEIPLAQLLRARQKT